MAALPPATAPVIVENLQQIIALGNRASSSMEQYLKENETLGEELASDLVALKSRMSDLEKNEDDMAIRLGKKTAELERVTETAKKEAADAKAREDALRRKVVMLEGKLRKVQEQLTVASGLHSNAGIQTESATTTSGQSSGRLPCTSMPTEPSIDRSGQVQEQANNSSDVPRARKRPRYRHDPVPKLSTGKPSLNTPFKLPPNPTSYPIRKPPRSRAVSDLPSYDSKVTAGNGDRSAVGYDEEVVMNITVPSTAPTTAPPRRHGRFPHTEPAVFLFEPDLKKLFGSLNHDMQQLWARIALTGKDWTRIDIEMVLKMMAGFEAGKRLDTKPATLLDKCAARIKVNPKMYQRCLCQEFDGPTKPHMDLQRSDQNRACKSCIKKRVGPCVYVKFAEDTGRSSLLGRLDKEKTPSMDFSGEEQSALMTTNTTRWELVKREDGVTVPPNEIRLARDAAALMVL